MDYSNLEIQASEHREMSVGLKEFTTGHKNITTSVLVDPASADL